jgi:4-hydroxy-tetrahydrodipicolinate reductase
MAGERLIRIAVHGATGRMGKRVCDLVRQDAALKLSAALASPSSKALGQDVGVVAGFGACGILVDSALPTDLDAVIDFSSPEACLEIVAQSAKRGIPVVVATTGFTVEQKSEVESAAKKTALLIAANCSLVVNVLMKLTETAGQTLRGRDFDVEIIERHHRFKADAPSGTALAFAQILQSTMGLDVQRHGREGITGVRPRNEIGLHAVRAGDNVGEHTIIFSTLGETMELVHKGHSRDSYAKGAIAAARFLAGKPPGLYSMADVLGI